MSFNDNELKIINSDRLFSLFIKHRIVRLNEALQLTKEQLERIETAKIIDKHLALPTRELYDALVSNINLEAYLIFERKTFSRRNSCRHDDSYSRQSSNHGFFSVSKPSDLVNPKKAIGIAVLSHAAGMW